ncbi:MAG TPA: hypothetical protein VHF90_09240 [Thermoleophilaceae bacterium]|nr:hypothetical protein [Thermoleophilaceae bacterium]
MASERGQASVEWVALVLLVALALSALLTTVPSVDGRSLGGALAHRFTCAVKGGCADGHDALTSAYGPRDAELVRRHLQGLVFEPGERQIPVDWRDCRAVECAIASGDRDLDVHRSAAGHPATVFTRLLRRGGRRYIEYWSYYPDSNTTWAGSDKIWKHSVVGEIGRVVTGSNRYPGYHPDDWEGAIVRVEADGRAAVRVTSHGHWQWCKQGCADRWGPTTGWTRVSRGSHAGHVPDDRARERTTTAEGIRLVPLEGIVKGAYRRLDPGISPPWDKDAYVNPETSES